MPDTLIPEGYTFLNPSQMMSKKGKELAIQLFEDGDKRDPDLHDMYIYNDFFAYGCLDLIDKCLSTLHTQIAKKNWPLCMSYLEALTIFMLRNDAWGMADDGERVDLTAKAYGACLVTVLRALKKNGQLNTDAYPALGYLLKNAAALGECVQGINAGSDFASVCKGIGKRLFKDQSVEEMKALHLARQKEWFEGLEGEERKTMEEVMNESDDDEDEEEDDDEDEDMEEGGAEDQGKKEGKPWWSGGREGAEDEKDADFVLSRVWKEYKDYLSDVPTKPLRGPPQWDLTKWSKADKARFSFDAMDD
ncbi:uncharacterized protein SCHCODRAFT_02628501 [Schizophyllum commune H4-8]|uniref:Uncharacterized protein n=1 Tax=Schizophyllum commune (strain H4-8 / FGSC 9210) TaxID=578458 RepID=D8Q830_SCHCM|nr:uncharacterized protein SCHCODRAFT_02628501 [Schizophyllum commune H4-8]KAI5891236.1 hypothetical protein SCHCODRAFT_02628501 [Schizophyllum commune H4-8]